MKLCCDGFSDLWRRNDEECEGSASSLEKWVHLSQNIYFGVYENLQHHILDIEEQRVAACYPGLAVHCYGHHWQR